MHNPANGCLRTQRWLPQVLAAILVITPAYAAEQAPASPRNSPAAAQPADAPPQAAPAPAQPTPTQPAPQKPLAPLPVVKNLKLMVLAGNGEMNDLERRVMAPLVVQVLDQNDRPVEGAEVVFRFPLNGPSATFTGGKTSQTTRSNGTGEAAAMNWVANSEVGDLEVHVTATYGNELGETTVKMSNVSRIVEGASNRTAKKKHWYSPTWVKVALIAGVAGAVAGVVLATRGGGHSTTNGNIPVTITPGAPTVGN